MTFNYSIHNELYRLYNDILDDDFNIKQVSKGILTQARAKLNSRAFSDSADTFIMKPNNLFGMGLLAVDGTILDLPNYSSIIEEFGVHDFGSNTDSKQS